MVVVIIMVFRIVPVIEAEVVGGRVPYVYAAAYEGGECSDGVLCSGEVPGDQIVASLHWLRTEARLRRWFIVGNDYVWPHVSNRLARGDSLP